MKTIKYLVMLVCMTLGLANVADAQYENVIKRNDFKFVKKELKTESDGFQWYMYTYEGPYGGLRYGAVNIEGKELSDGLEYEVDFDKKTSGYISSHKVFLWGRHQSGGGLTCSGFCGTIYTCQGGMIAEPNCVESFNFSDHGIIVANSSSGAYYNHYAGVYNNNMVVVPFKYRDILYLDNCYVCRHGYSEMIKYDIYNEKGRLIGSEIGDYQTIDGKLFYFDGENTLDKGAKIFVKGRIKGIMQDVNNEDYLLVENKSGIYGLFDMSGHEIISPQYKEIVKCGNNSNIFIKVLSTNGKKGLFDFSGAEILAAEFEDCDWLDNDLFKFKLNDYWGVLNRQGNVVIPLSRQYTKIDYSRTLKTFAFEKEDGRKGECNAKGVQTSITKAQAQKPESKSSKTSSSALTGSNKGNYKMGDKYYNIEFHGEYLLVESKRFEFESLKEGCFYYSSEELNLWLVYCDINEIKVYNNEAFLAYQLYGKDIHAILKRVE